MGLGNLLPVFFNSRYFFWSHISHPWTLGVSDFSTFILTYNCLLYFNPIRENCENASIAPPKHFYYFNGNGREHL